MLDITVCVHYPSGPSLPFASTSQVSLCVPQGAPQVLAPVLYTYTITVNKALSFKTSDEELRTVRSIGNRKNTVTAHIYLSRRHVHASKMPLWDESRPA
jgi:hypothetical protein